MALSVNSKYGCSMISADLNQKTAMVFGANAPLSGFDVSKKSNTSVDIASGVAVVNGARIESTEIISVSVPSSLTSKSKLYVVIEYIHITSEVSFKITNTINENMAILAEITMSSGSISNLELATKLKTLKQLADELEKKAGPGGASPDGSGLMSPDDKKKLDSIEWYANKYVHPKTHPASMITQSSQRRFVSDTEKSVWNNKISKDDYEVGTNGMLQDVKTLSSSNNVLAVAKSGRYRGIGCTNAPTSGVVFYDIENFVNGSKNYRIVTARAVSSSSYINVFNGSKWSGWGIQYNSNIAHNHDDLYYRKSSFEMLYYSTSPTGSEKKVSITQGSTSFSGTANAYKMPNGIIMFWGQSQVTSLSNTPHIDITVSWPYIFPKRADAFAQITPLDGSYDGVKELTIQKKWWAENDATLTNDTIRIVANVSKIKRKVLLSFFAVGR